VQIGVPLAGALTGALTFEYDARNRIKGTDDGNKPAVATKG
jgi:hypothetical protein